MDKKSRKLWPVWLTARARAAWNKDKGGVLLSGEYTKGDHNGNHYRVLVDGGNRYDGRFHWIIARASGGGYCLKDEAMAAAVSAVLCIPMGDGEDDIRYDNWNSNWSKIAKKNGWTLLDWSASANTIALIPSDDTAAKIRKEIADWEQKNHD